MSTASKVYTVLVFADYRKEVEIDVLKVFLKQDSAISFAEQMVKDAGERAEEDDSDDEEECQDNKTEAAETDYVELHGKKVYARKLATYRGFSGPVLAVVEVDAE